jgi:hypothetical protein
MDLTGNGISGYYGGGVPVSSSQTMSVVVSPEENKGIMSLAAMLLASAKEEPSCQIASSILGDDVMAKEGLTFLLLHIGKRWRDLAQMMTSHGYPLASLGKM